MVYIEFAFADILATYCIRVIHFCLNLKLRYHFTRSCNVAKQYDTFPEGSCLNFD